MNTDTASRWLTFGANVGVVIGLILLLIELNQNSDLVRAQIHQARTDEHVTRLENRANTEFLAPALLKFGSAGGFGDDPVSAIEQLSPIEAYRVRRFLSSRATDYANLYYQYEQGYLDEEFYQFTVVTAIERFGPLWEELGLFDAARRTPGFAAEVSRILAGT